MTTAWPAVPLGEVLTERQERPSADDLLTGRVRIVSKIGFNDGVLQFRLDGETKTGMILIRPSDLVVSGINAAKGSIAVYGTENEGPAAATIHYGAYSPKGDRVDTMFLWWLLRSGTFRELLRVYVPGGIKTELKAKRLLPVPIPLPPLQEQRRVVARIEELAGRVEETRGCSRDAAVEADALVAGAIAITLDGVPVTGRLSDVLLSDPRNGWSVRCDNVETGVPVLTLSAVTGFRYRETEFKRTSARTIPNAHYWLEPGDLLITRSNTPDLVGHAAIYDGAPAPCIYPDLVMKLVVDDASADRRFVHWWLRSVTARDYIRANAKGTSPTMKKVSQGIVKAIPFPSQLGLDKQRSAVERLDALQTKVDELKRLQAETQAELAALMPSILDRAFRGEL